MYRLLAACALVLVAGLAAGEDYLKDGKLTERLVVKDVQGGFAGFTGTQWTVQPDGKWEEARVFNRKVEVKRSGTLGKKELAALADELKKYDPATLKDTGKVSANPHVVTVGYGKHSAKLNLRAGAPLPKPDAKTAEGRFAGVVAAVRSAIPKK